MTKVLFLIVACLSFFINYCFAQSKVSLVTVSPGPVVFQSFGHTLIFIQDTADLSQGELYDYGMVDPVKLISSPNFLNAFVDFFNSKIPAKPTKVISKIDAKTGIAETLVKNYLSDPANYRKITIDELNLTETQITALKGFLKADFDAGDYKYNNYTNNCATRVRDRMFDDTVLAKSNRKLYEDTKVDTSKLDIALASIDEAIKLNGSHTLKLFPPEFTSLPEAEAPLSMLEFLGIQSEYKSANEVYKTLKAADNQLQEILPGPFANAFHAYFFNDDLSNKPIPEWDAMFTPARLREALIKTVNPDIKDQKIIDATKAKFAETPAPVIAAPQPQPEPKPETKPDPKPDSKNDAPKEEEKKPEPAPAPEKPTEPKTIN